MKKLIFTSLSLAVAGFAVAQQAPVQNTTPRFKAANEVVSPKHQSKLGKSVVSDWYEPWNMAGKAGAESFFKGFVQFITPDSLPKYIDDADTINRFQDISVGQICDPKDDNIDLTDNPGIKLTKYSGYTLDSIYFSYLYVRNVDSVADGLGGNVPVVDTIIISYFKMNGSTGLQKGTLSGTPQNVFARPQWNKNTLMPTGFLFQQKYLLTRDDSTTVINSDGGFENSWRSKILTLAPDQAISIPAGGAVDNIVGFTLNFKPGMAYDSNSVYIYQKDPVAHPLSNPRVNYFGYRFLSNEGTDDQQVQQTKFYDNSLRATKASAYTASGGSSWDGYIPGSAFFDKIYFQSGFHLTSNNVGIKEIKNDNFAMSSVYPNPAQVNSTILAAFNLKQSANVRINVINLVGQEVKNLVNATYAAGEHAEEMNISGIKPGVYFVTMTVNGVSATKKLTITE